MVVLAALAGYLIGSVPSGLIIGRLLTGKDVRQQGSGHTGGLNVLRLAGFWAGAATAVVDAALGAGAALAANWLYDAPWSVTTASASAVVGHNWSIWLRFGGGIGLSKLAGGLLAVDPLSVLIILVALVLVWLGLTLLLKMHRARATVLVLLLLGPSLLAAGATAPVVYQGVLGGAAVIIKTLPDWRRRYS